MCVRDAVQLCRHSFDISQYTIVPQTNGMIPTIRINSVMFFSKFALTSPIIFLLKIRNVNSME